ncbi:MAG: very short patch repair endonuclease [Acidimicrobiales bacterium]
MNATDRKPPGQAKSRAMRAQREKNTGPEVALRRELHRRGLRYRLHRRVLPDLRRELDIVFGPAKVAVDVRGCFWHACPEHATYPKANADWWARKLKRNVERDRDTEKRLADAGWKLIVVWEHDDPSSAADWVERAATSRR